jgi:hypothetical protein
LHPGYGGPSQMRAQKGGKGGRDGDMGECYASSLPSMVMTGGLHHPLAAQLTRISRRPFSRRICAAAFLTLSKSHKSIYTISIRSFPLFTIISLTHAMPLFSSLAVIMRFAPANASRWAVSLPIPSAGRGQHDVLRPGKVRGYQMLPR